MPENASPVADNKLIKTDKPRPVNTMKTVALPPQIRSGKARKEK
jgi:hypothetical protein